MKKTRFIAFATTAAVGVTLLTGCATEDDDCRSTPVVMFFGTDRHYHYGSPTGKIVPATQVPASARKVAGYKPPSAKVAPPPKVNTSKPAPRPNVKPAAPRSGRR